LPASSTHALSELGVSHSMRCVRRPWWRSHPLRAAAGATSTVAGDKLRFRCPRNTRNTGERPQHHNRKEWALSQPRSSPAEVGRFRSGVCAAAPFKCRARSGLGLVSADGAYIGRADSARAEPRRAARFGRTHRGAARSGQNLRRDARRLRMRPWWTRSHTCHHRFRLRAVCGALARNTRHAIEPKAFAACLKASRRLERSGAFLKYRSKSRRRCVHNVRVVRCS
jgi:hypothetical protein